ncbi:hypothetical protein HYFRA_00003228 [Hymenoscyphus fraxineus]|uniref:2EXR domain-containing protein n=1 Tax=Hymenoscyphus fraxineus TaxID=746836 RepID=A0A9N9KRY5_9HELO|nr:hypothetical protein HYFRA_00003228 [Hymenoscyphus fraxineus]
MAPPPNEVPSRQMVELQEMLNTLRLRNVELEQKNMQLVAENRLLRNQVRNFPKFRLLPIELRWMIWRFACLAPKTHIIDNGPTDFPHAALALVSQLMYTDRSNFKIINSTCKDARAALSTLSLSYFAVPKVYDGSPVQMATYFLPSVDTFWLFNDWEDRHKKSALFVKYPWFCGRCHRKFPSVGQVRTCGAGCLGRVDVVGGSIQLRRIAITLKDWRPHVFLWEQSWECARVYAWSETVDVLGTLGTAIFHGVQEILLVVEQFGDFRHETDIVFTTPSCEQSRKTLLRQVRPGRDGNTLFGSDVQNAPTWAESERLINESMEEFRTRHSEFRTAVLSLGLTTSQEITAGQRPGLIDLSTYTFPRFRFVEARKGKDVCSLPPGVEIV